jgi:hypothetical protein
MQDDIMMRYMEVEELVCMKNRSYYNSSLVVASTLGIQKWHE